MRKGKFQFPLANEYAPTMSDDFIQSVFSMYESSFFEVIL